MGGYKGVRNLHIGEDKTWHVYSVTSGMAANALSVEKLVMSNMIGTGVSVHAVAKSEMNSINGMGANARFVAKQEMKGTYLTTAYVKFAAQYYMIGTQMGFVETVRLSLVIYFQGQTLIY